MKILSVLKVATTNQIDTNRLQSPYYNTPPLMRSQYLEELDTRKNKHKWYTMFRPLCVDSGNMEISFSLKIIKIRMEWNIISDLLYEQLKHA